MPTLTMSSDGSIHLPDAIRDRYGLTPDRPLRIIETKDGILIVPLTDGPMDAELAKEPEEWQSLAQKARDSDETEFSSPSHFELDPYHRNVPDQELLNELLRVARLLRRNSVTIDQFNEHAKFHSCTLQRRFGSWFKASEAAGLSKSRNLNITNEQLFENLAAVWLKIGRQPKYKDLMNENSLFSIGTYENRFGTWRKGLAAFVAWANEGKVLESNNLQVPDYRAFDRLPVAFRALAGVKPLSWMPSHLPTMNSST